MRINSICDPNLDYVRDAFKELFGEPVRPFGPPNSGRQGVSDDAQGVQWNAGVEDRNVNTAWLGVNLEGIEYDGWPIARFIERELNGPSLPDLYRSIPGSGAITMSFRRDAWQVTARPQILERQIGRTPISLADLTLASWREILLEAYQCLNPDRHHRGRTRQVVTLKTGRKVEMWVSPHLGLYYIIWRAVPRTLSEAEAAMRRGQEVLQPIYDFVKHRSD